MGYRFTHDPRGKVSPDDEKNNLKRKVFFVDESTLRRAKELLGLSSESEVVRAAVERVVEIEEFWQFMKDSRGVLEPGSFEAP